MLRSGARISRYRGRWRLSARHPSSRVGCSLEWHPCRISTEGCDPDSAARYCRCEGARDRSRSPPPTSKGRNYTAGHTQRGTCHTEPRSSRGPRPVSAARSPGSSLGTGTTSSSSHAARGSPGGRRGTRGTRRHRPRRPDRPRQPREPRGTLRGGRRGAGHRGGHAGQQRRHRDAGQVHRGRPRPGPAADRAQHHHAVAPDEAVRGRHGRAGRRAGPQRRLLGGVPARAVHGRLLRQQGVPALVLRGAPRGARVGRRHRDRALSGAGRDGVPGARGTRTLPWGTRKRRGCWPRTGRRPTTSPARATRASTTARPSS